MCSYEEGKLSMLRIMGCIKLSTIILSRCIGREQSCSNSASLGFLDGLLFYDKFLKNFFFINIK